MRSSALPVVLASLALLSGCGDSSEQTTSGSGKEESATQSVRSAWERAPGCARPRGASRWGCSVGPYRCQAVVAGRGWSVSCSKPGESISFLVRRG